MKNTVSILLLSTILLTYCSYAWSQSNTEAKPPSWIGISIGSTEKGVSQKLIAEYRVIISKYKTEEKEWWKAIESNISMKDKGRLEQIFKQMSTIQQAQQKVAFIKGPPPLKKAVPTDTEFNSWKNANIYGVWINGKKVENVVLNRYKKTDFDQASVSKLYGAAKRNKQYSHQLNLMTKDYYRRYYEQTIAKSGSRIVFRA